MSLFSSFKTPQTFTTPFSSTGVLDELNCEAPEFVPNMESSQYSRSPLDGGQLLAHDDLVAKLNQAVADADFLLANRLKLSLEQSGCKVIGQPVEQIHITVQRPGSAGPPGRPLTKANAAPVAQAPSALQPCPAGAACHRLLTGTCTFHHTAEEVTAAATLVAAQSSAKSVAATTVPEAEPTPQRGKTPPAKGTRGGEEVTREYSVFLRNIPNNYTWQNLRDVFNQAFTPLARFLPFLDSISAGTAGGPRQRRNPP